MKTQKIAEQVKDVIMSELFIDINGNQCAIDLFLDNSDEFKKNSEQMNKVSLLFLERTKDNLQKEHDRGQILFFRKYGYEKILNVYLEKTYHTDSLEMNMFPSEERKKELEKQRLERLKIEEQNRREEDILKSVSSRKWEKIVRIDTIVYKTIDSHNITLELHVADKYKKRKNCVTNILLYNKKPLSYVEYDYKNLVQIIEETHPQKQKPENIIVVTRPEHSKKNFNKESRNVLREDDNKTDLLLQAHEKYKLELAKKYGLNPDSLQNLVGYYRNRCKHFKDKGCSLSNRPCSVFFSGCICHDSFIVKIEKMSQKKENKKEKCENNRVKVVPKIIIEKPAISLMQSVKEQELPQIGLKDFLVRCNVFKCMHEKHKISNIVAMVNIDDNGKKRLEKVSAGYCPQCKVYFIMDSTYQRLKNMGIILCRVSDEKTYLKGGFINGMQLAQESILMQYGYNVSQTEGLSAVKRQKILAVMIDNKIMSKSEIISYLDFFIRHHGSRSNMAIAISKWEEDREFVENYWIGEYSKFGVNAIYRR